MWLTQKWPKDYSTLMSPDPISYMVHKLKLQDNQLVDPVQSNCQLSHYTVLCKPKKPYVLDKLHFPWKYCPSISEIVYISCTKGPCRWLLDLFVIVSVYMCFHQVTDQKGTRMISKWSIWYPLQ